ncbi:rod shape-determining protein RodA [Candidatus Gottesmanbacteria bacterium]|nr:rod shape-determining protein RodA [Candidatus Gottesmanbacteria bacterium]
MKFFKIPDLGIFLPALVIYFLGISILLSIAPNLFLTQVFYGLIAIFLYVIFSQIDYHVYSNSDKVFYLISLVFLVLTFLIGSVTRGSVRWIDLGIIRLQASELIKPLMIVFLASSYLKKDFNLKRFLVDSFLFSLIVFIILKQPDLGNVVVFLSFWLIILFASGFKVVLMPLIGALAIFVLPLFWRFLKGYQKERIISFLSPQADPLGIGYNAIQAMVAVGSGGLLGRGLGRGTQSHLLFLPEYHTDFIFASFAEEFGFIGVVLLLGLYFLLLMKILKISQKAEDKFGFLLSLGIFMIIFTQTVINVGMNIGLLPITGITLPLVSYGGSSLVSVAVILGIITNISHYKREPDTILIR